MVMAVAMQVEDSRDPAEYTFAVVVVAMIVCVSVAVMRVVMVAMIVCVFVAVMRVVVVAMIVFVAIMMAVVVMLVRRVIMIMDPTGRMRMIVWLGCF